MRKHFLKLLIALTILSSCNASTKEIKSDINTEKTDRHINVPNTKLFIIPPDKFIYSSDISGFEYGNKAMIQVFNELDKSKINTGEFNESKFNNKESLVLEYKEFKLNGYPAKFNHIQRNKAVDEYNLLFGDSTFSVILMAICATDKPEIGNNIKSSLLSVTYDKNMVVDPLQIATFEMTDSSGNFKFVKSLSAVYYYSIDGVDRLNEPNEPRIIITSIPNRKNQTAKTLLDETISALKERGFTIIKTINEKDKQLNGYDAFHTKFEGVWNGEPTTIFLQTIVSGKNGLLIQGVYPRQVSVNESDFMKLCAKIRMK